MLVGCRRQLQVFPTQVGVIPFPTKILKLMVGVPHTGGGDPDVVILIYYIDECSPHRWG